MDRRFWVMALVAVVVALAAVKMFRKPKEASMTQETPSPEDYYQAIGRLVVQFEHATEQVRLFIMHLGNLIHTEERRRVARTFMSNMSAVQLWELCHALFSDFSVPGSKDKIVSPSKDDFRVMRDLSNRWDEVRKKRNEAVHSTWFIGWGDGETVVAAKRRRKRAGLVYEALERAPEEFDEIAEQAKALAEILFRVQGQFSISCIAIHDGKEVEHLIAGAVAFDDEGNVSGPSGPVSATPP